MSAVPGCGTPVSLMVPLIAVDGLTKRYDKFLAVDGLSFDVHAGEIFGLLGPNGAGKTSTLKMLAGVMAPTAGTITIDGVDAVMHPQAAKRVLGFLPQDTYAYEKLTGREFLHFVAEVRGIPLVDRRPLFDHWLNLFELTPDADKLIEGYSGGMLKKLLLIVTFLHDPPVLLLDEPTIELDPLTVRRVRRHIQDRATAGRAILLSTHVLEIAERLCDRIAIIYQGRICALGTMDELRAIYLPSGQGTLEDVFIQATGADIEEEAILEKLAEVQNEDLPVGPYEA